MRSLHYWLLGMSFVVAVAVGAERVGRAGDPSTGASLVGWLGASPSAGASDAPVIVLLVETRASLVQLRQKLRGQAVLAESKRAFALEGLVVASSLEAASDPLNQLGWASRPLEIVSRAQGQRAARDRPGPGSPEGAGPSLAALAQKDRLTRADAERLLDHLDRAP